MAKVAEKKKKDNIYDQDLEDNRMEKQERETENVFSFRRNKSAKGGVRVP